MNLDQYLSSDGAPSVAQLRERMRSLGYKVKSDAQIRQWRHGYAGRRPDPENCVGLELASDGIVTRRELRPDDWQLIWPELAPKEASAKRSSREGAAPPA
jgi:DNA-binding transcriptional regulator YdaS (Cro superfamily)